MHPLPEQVGIDRSPVVTVREIADGHEQFRQSKPPVDYIGKSRNNFKFFFET